MDPPGKAAEAAVGARQTPTRSPAKGTTLLDVYEVEWITRELERLLVRTTETESGCGGGGGSGGHHRREGKKVRLDTKPSTCWKGGFLAELVGRHAVSICGDAAARRRPSAARPGQLPGGGESLLVIL
ncbi:hypothetical protein GUJ93_ZPchr0002g25195 [Zizania palustris]|uniref:Uncharacterized protein n=1 Tax=Zizania palustris TaxID=103762 RepID=A0A8J5VTG2_ZIZPA|nr:hypothetical protein GUJ93_ZPchr0002g25195 [Zizania palustris]